MDIFFVFITYFCIVISSSSITPHENLPQGDESFVASGSTCMCYRVRLHGRLLLKKQLLQSLGSDERRRKALEKEFEIGFNLEHPNIPRYVEFHGDYLLMEYVDGETLMTFHEHHPDFFKDSRCVQQFVEELCSAVDYLHQHQVIHLDLKPDNIMMTRIGNHVKLIDLGYCYQDSYPFTTGGTTHYAAPEKEKSPASDIYSLGRIFNELGIASETVTTKCLRANAADRYQSIDELMAAMRPRSVIRNTVFALFLVILLGVLGWWWVEKKDHLATAPVMVTTAPNAPAEDVVQVAPSRHQIVTSDHATSENVVPNVILPNENPKKEKMPITNEADEVKTEKEEMPFSNTNAITTTTTDKEEIHKRPVGANGMLRGNQLSVFASFKPVTDSILTELKEFVANDRMPYLMGEAYKVKYDSLKNVAFRCGTKDRNVPFWIRTVWMKYDGNPKPFDPMGDYLYQALANIESRYQTRVANYNLNQK